MIMCRLFLLWMFLCCSAIFPQTIQGVKIGFESPHEGPFPTTTVFHGDTVIIVWHVSGLTGSVQIELIGFSPSPVLTVAGTYPCQDSPKYLLIPATATPGTYFIRISQGNTSGDSAPFVIKENRIIAWVNVFPEGDSRASRSFKPGQTIAVSWDTTRILGTVKILLRRETLSIGHINRSIIISSDRPYNDIPASYGLPAKMPAGDYVITVEQGSVRRTSRTFSIGKSSSLLKKKRIKG